MIADACSFAWLTVVATHEAWRLIAEQHRQRPVGGWGSEPDADELPEPPGTRHRRRSVLATDDRSGAPGNPGDVIAGTIRMAQREGRLKVEVIGGRVSIGVVETST